MNLRLLPLLILLPLFGHTQIQGTVSDATGQGIPGITVLVEASASGASTDVHGHYKISGLDKGSYTLKFSGVGFETTTRTLTYTGESLRLNITLEESTSELKSVLVVGKSEVTEKREVPFAVSVIDVKPLQVQNLDVNQILGTVSGVRIREEGGLGSNFNFSLNGFTGKQVRFFMDGIPMESYGSSLSLNNIPVNMITGIEVYKGVVPVRLATDALGGVVNVTTDQNPRNYLNASYSVGSFNSHRASILTRYSDKKTGLTFNSNLFFNYSDNSYKMYGVEVPKTDGSGKVDTVNVHRFHDGYQSQTGQVEIGVVNKPFADRLFVGFIATGNDKEVQNGYNMQNVYGRVHTTDRMYIPTLRYKKSNLLIEDLNLSAYATYTIKQGVRIDTSSRIYNWYGTYTIRTNNAGEFSYNKSHLTFNDRAITTGTNLNYSLDENHSFAFNHTLSTYTREGKDPLRNASEVPFTEPNAILKNGSALGYNLELFNDNWKSSLFVKSFTMHSDTRVQNVESGEYEQELIELAHQGFGFASTYHPTKWGQLKISYENTYRLPEGEEMFGDGLFVQPNNELKPEKSSNYNAGLMVNYPGRNHSVYFESNYLFRDATNFIRLDASSPINSVYLNQAEVLLSSIEGNIRYSYKSLLNFQASITKQRSVNNDREDRLYKDDLPNQPYLFGNAGFAVQFQNVGLENSQLSINWFTLFVDKFYWKWPSQGTKRFKYDIPQQVSHDLTISYSFGDGAYSTSLACSNLTNALRYDNFAMQKPGRSFSLKLNYYLSNNK